MKIKTIITLIALFLFTSIGITKAVTIAFPQDGGTGTASIPTYGQMLVGNSAGTYTLTATSSLGISGAGGEANTGSSLGTGLNLFDSKSGVDLRFNTLSAGTNITLSTTSNNNTIVINNAYGDSNVNSYIHASTTIPKTYTNNTFTGLQSFSNTGTTTFSGGLSTSGLLANDFLETKFINATSTTATSTFAGGVRFGNLLFYEGATGHLSLGVEEYDQNINGTLIPSIFTTHTEGATARGDASYHRHSDTAIRGATLYGTRSRGTEASESAVQNDDNLFDIIASGHDGTDYENSSRIDFEVDGTVSNNVIPGYIRMRTANTGGTMTDGLVINSSQYVGIGSSTPGSLLSIGGNGTGINFIDGTSATSTISGNLHIKGNQQVDGSLFAPITFTGGNVSLTSLTLTNPLAVAYGGTGATSGYNNTNWDTAYTNRITSAVYPLSIASNIISTAMSSSTLIASSPLTGSFAQVGTGGSLGCQTASGSQAGCLSSTDWTTFNNKGVGTILSGTTGQIPYYASSGTTLTATSSLFIDSDQNIGIGTANPTNPLHVYSNNASGMLFERSTSNNSNIQYKNPNGSMYAGISATANFGIGGAADLSTASLTVLKSNGNVGVGTTSPYRSFSVADGAVFGSDIISSYFTATSTTVTSTFPNASTTQLTSGTNTFYVDSNGRISGKDTTQSLTGVISPVRHIALSTATTTAWTASTTGAYIPSIVAPFAGTIQNAVCSTDTSFLGIDIYIASTHLTYFVASTTVGIIQFSSSNTFTSGQLINMSAGTTTTSGASKVTCTLRITETI